MSVKRWVWMALVGVMGLAATGCVDGSAGGSVGLTTAAQSDEVGCSVGPNSVLDLCLGLEGATSAGAFELVGKRFVDTGKCLTDYWLFDIQVLRSWSGDLEPGERLTVYVLRSSEFQAAVGDRFGYWLFQAKCYDPSSDDDHCSHLFPVFMARANSDGLYEYPLWDPAGIKRMSLDEMGDLIETAYKTYHDTGVCVEPDLEPDPAPPRPVSHEDPPSGPPVDSPPD